MTPAHPFRSATRRLAGIALVLGALCAAAPAAAAPAQDHALPAGAGQQALGLRVGDGGVIARACASGACSAEGGKALEVPADAAPRLGQARVRAVTLADGKRLARIDVPAAAEGGAWVMLVAAPLTGKGGEPVVLWSGWTGVSRGEHGEERSGVVLEEPAGPAGKGSRVVVGQHRADVTLCGRPTVVAAREVDPATMTLARGASVQNLSAEERAKAVKLTVARREGPLVPSPYRVIRATAASSAVGKRLAEIADGNAATAWAENREGVGRGEFISFSAPSEVGIRALELRIRPEARAEGGALDPEAVGPRNLFVATPDRVFSVQLPEDAWAAQGAGFEVTLPAEVQASCLAIVLDDTQAPRGVKNPKVTIAEVTARTAFDGQSPEALVGALAGGGDRARAAAALLVRGGPDAIRAAMEGYDKLDEQGRLLAAGVIDAAPCAGNAAFFAERFGSAMAAELAETKVRQMALPGELGPEAHHARDRIRRCGREAAPVLAKLVLAAAEPGPGKQANRVDRAGMAAARELALIAPGEAIPVLLDAIARAKDATRKELRAALAQAAQSDRAAEALVAELAAGRFGARPEVARIDLLRAMGPALGRVQGAGSAFQGTVGPSASFRTRYLLLAPAAELARARDAQAEAWLRAALRKDADPHVRARAAEVAARVPALVPDLMAAAADPEVRVREAAVSALGVVAESGARAPAGAEAALTARLGDDPWTFVRSRAARALGALPAGKAADQALARALEWDASPEVRGHALDALGAHRATAHIEVVRDRAEDKEEDIEVRARAILALAEMCDRSSVDLWTRLSLRARTPSGEADHRLGTAALAALGHVHPADLQKRLAPMFDKGTPHALKEMARAAIQTTGKCGR